eukprot:66786-Amphidinium_carterae.2
MNHEATSDTFESPAMPATTTDNKPKGICFNMVKHGKCVKGTSCPYSHDGERVKKEQERRRAKSPKSGLNKDSPRGSARSPGRSQERKPSPKRTRNSSPRDGRKSSPKGERNASPAGSRGRSPLRSSSPCHEFKASGIRYM